MRRRRWIIIASAFIVVSAAGFLLLQNAPLAQPPPPPPGGPEMGPDMMGPPGPGGMGGPSAAAEGGLEWADREDPPEELAMTYDDFIAQTGLEPNIPERFTVDAEGEPITATFNSWMQLQRVYVGGKEVRLEEIEPGRVGAKLTGEARKWAAYRWHASSALSEAYLNGLGGFTFKVSYPVMADANVGGIEVSKIGPGSLSVIVVMRVRSSLQRTYGQKVYDRMKKYDCLGYASTAGGSLAVTSMPFSIHTFKGGYWRPRTINLPPEAALVWGAMWSQNIVRLSVKNRNGDVIYTAEQSAGQGPDILSRILNPPELYYNPKWRLLVPPEDLKFQGGRLNLNGTKGWAYMFTFSLPPAEAIQMHSASAELVGLDREAIEDMAQGAQAPSAAPAGGGGMPGGPEGEMMGPDMGMPPPGVDMPPPPPGPGVVAP